MRLGHWLRWVGNVVDRDTRHHAALGHETRDEGLAVRGHRRNFEVRDCLLGDELGRVVPVLVEVARPQDEALPRLQLEADGLIRGPPDHGHRQRAARVALEAAGVEALALAFPLQAPEVYVVRVLGVPLLVRDQEVPLRREEEVSHAARSSTDVRGDLRELHHLLVLVIGVVQADTLVAHGRQAVTVGAPCVAEGVRRRWQGCDDLNCVASRGRLAGVPVAGAVRIRGDVRGVHDDDAILGGN
mmetsp:Transcript_46171/g.133013  ORF Transcript_46171/g.133013 Transcript_46171/m.133013 type:complete len:243 (+) Transcript_46171:1509-2237(+)